MRTQANKLTTIKKTAMPRIKVFSTAFPFRGSNGESQWASVALPVNHAQGLELSPTPSEPSQAFLECKLILNPHTCTAFYLTGPVPCLNTALLPSHLAWQTASGDLANDLLYETQNRYTSFFIIHTMRSCQLIPNGTN